jgi:hypothetical protein
MSNDEKELKKLIKKINKKMENPAIKKKVNDAISVIEQIFESEIDINIVYPLGVEDYKKVVESYDEKELLKVLPNTVISLGEFKTILDREADKNLKLTIDPIYLTNKGINEIYDVIITTLDDKIILVPKNKENGE